ncbi:hypothetical protein M426DRAFT_27364 [Hypoxylon sp. CI-4A]|nr:hypothetical protein M426DRAFT_27364 [Hypoxylon sp. CI-4A]
MTNYSPAQVLCVGREGTGFGNCHTKHIVLPDPDLIPEPRNGNWPRTLGFNELQYSREEWLPGDALDNALKLYLQGLPSEVANKVHLATADLDDTLFYKEEAAYNRAVDKTLFRRYFAPFKQKEYTLWPVNCIGKHWILAVIRKTKVDKLGNDWDRVAQISLIDSYRDSAGSRERKNLVSERIRGLLSARGFTFAPGCERIVWTPWQRDGWSCGLRVFWAAKQILGRILSFAEDQIEYSEALWDDLSGWFDPDATRWEMVGLCAHHLIGEMNYSAKVAVELINDVLDEDGKEAKLAERIKPPNNGVKRDIERPLTRKRLADNNPNRRKAEAVPELNSRKILPSYSLKKGDRAKRVKSEGTADNPVWIDSPSPPGLQRGTAKNPVLLGAPPRFKLPRGRSAKRLSLKGLTLEGQPITKQPPKPEPKPKSGAPKGLFDGSRDFNPRNKK